MRDRARYLGMPADVKGREWCVLQAAALAVWQALTPAERRRRRAQVRAARAAAHDRLLAALAGAPCEART